MPAVVLAPSGPAAAKIAALGWVLLSASAVVYVLTLLALALAVWRRRERPAGAPAPDAWARRIIVATAGATALVVAALLLTSLRTVDALRPASPPAVTVHVVGHRWWWEIRYPDHDVVTANELHLPARASVQLELSTPDVIHSFWVPSLHGKLDLVPGRRNTLRLDTPGPGVHRGQCAEFCGVQHARMGLLVVVEAPEAFARWLAAQRAPAGPADEPRQAGEQLFLTWCVACHAVRGTPAAGRIGPDLTHVGSRRTLAAGSVANTPEALAAWIADPHAIKPGVLMPALPLGPEPARAVAGYLAGLR
jgi:cytochrome c oxidase subunit 2